MAVNFIVLAVTLLMSAYVGVWICSPRLRAWMETPKYRFLELQREFPQVLRDHAPGRDDAQLIMTRCISARISPARQPTGLSAPAINSAGDSREGGGRQD